MANTFNENERIGKIVTDFPKSTEIFMKYNIDFCCGGDRSLATAINEDNVNIDISTVLNEVNESFSNFLSKDYKDTDWESMSMAELLDHIENTHHAFLRKALPITEEVLLKIFKVHYEHNKDLLIKVYQLFASLKLELNIHLIKEEKELFPLIKEYEETKDSRLLAETLKFLEEIESEHVGAGDILKNLRKITNNYVLPEYSCTTFGIAYEKLQEIESDLFHHIHLENNIIFHKLKSIK